MINPIELFSHADRTLVFLIGILCGVGIVLICTVIVGCWLGWDGTK